MKIARFLGVRFAGAAAVLAIISVGTFMMMSILPGDAASAVLGRAPEERLEAFREEFGLERPAVERFGDWAGGAITGDLGESYSSRNDVWALIRPRLENSLILGAIAAVATIAIGIVIGTIAGTRADSRFDRVSSTFSIGFLAVPEFALGTVLAYLLGIYWNIFPAVSIFPLEEGPLSRPSTLVLPVMTLVVLNIGFISRLVRANVIEAMSSPAAVQARLNGESKSYVMWKVALSDAIPATAQAAALLVVYLIGGLVVIEAVFQYQGIGQLGVTAALARDFPLVQGITVVMALLYLIVTTVVEAIVVLLNPKLREAL